MCVCAKQCTHVVNFHRQALPDSEKNKYRMMCGENREKLDCRGVPLRQLEEEAQDVRRQAEEMKKSITEMVDFYHGGESKW